MHAVHCMHFGSVWFQRDIILSEVKVQLHFLFMALMVSGWQGGMGQEKDRSIERKWS